MLLIGEESCGCHPKNRTNSLSPHGCFSFQMECVNSFKYSHSLHSPSASVHVQEILKKDTGAFVSLILILCLTSNPLSHLVFGRPIDDTLWVGYQFSVPVWKLNPSTLSAHASLKSFVSTSLSLFHIVNSFKDKDWSSCPLCGALRAQVRACHRGELCSTSRQIRHGPQLHLQHFLPPPFPRLKLTPSAPISLNYCLSLEYIMHTHTSMPSYPLVFLSRVLCMEWPKPQKRRILYSRGHQNCSL